MSKLGDFDSYGADPRRIEKAGDSFNGVKVDYASKYKSALSVVKNNYEALKVPYYGLDNDDYVNGLGFCCKPTTPTNATTSPTGKSTNSKADNAELQQYYYHPDHLGSSSYITNLDGEVVQHVEYVPFGEVFLEEKNAVWNTPYLFNGKELDKETGMSYYGARYYDSKTSVWISVDNEMEKYPNWSPYNYCKQSPISRYDPDGNDDIFTSSGRFVKHIDNGTNYIMIQQGNRLSRIDNFDGSSRWFSSKDDNNRLMMANVVKYYLGGITKTTINDGVANEEPDALAFYDKPGDKGIKVALNNGFFPSILSNSNNLMDTLLHEYFHKLDDKNGVIASYFSHASVYVNQMKSNIFSNCTEEFQLGMISNFTSYMQGIASEEVRGSLIEKFNRTNKGGYRLENPGSGGPRLFGKDGKPIILPLKATPETPN